jgi:dephospho-CoA kinase
VLNSTVRSIRAKLSEIVFANDEKRKQLNSILHPFIYRAAGRNHPAMGRASTPNAIAIIDAAFDVESGGYKTIRSPNRRALRA